MEPAATLRSTDDLFRLKTEEARQRLHDFRIAWESANAATDPTLRFTSQAPAEVQDWLLEHQPQLYFDGLPPFVQAFFTDCCQEAAASGRLDNLPGVLLMLFTINRGRLTR